MGCAGKKIGCLDQQPSTHGFELEPKVVARRRRHIEQTEIFLARQPLERGGLKSRRHHGFHEQLREFFRCGSIHGAVECDH